MMFWETDRTNHKNRMHANSISSNFMSGSQKISGQIFRIIVLENTYKQIKAPQV